jgi:hypothetical protein
VTAAAAASRSVMITVARTRSGACIAGGRLRPTRVTAALPRGGLPGTGLVPRSPASPRGPSRRLDRPDGAFVAGPGEYTNQRASGRERRDGGPGRARDVPPGPFCLVKGFGPPSSGRTPTVATPTSPRWATGCLRSTSQTRPRPGSPTR